LRCGRDDGGFKDGAQYAKRSQYGKPDYLLERIGRNAFATEAEAKARAKVLVANKIKEIDKQLVKLRKLLDSL